MSKTMHAAAVEEFGKPLVLKEWDVPSPGPGQILVKTEACGVCHTDLHAAHGDWPVKPSLPFIPGHEAIGLVAAVGAGVTIVKEGDRPRRNGEWIAISGVGGLGHLAVQDAKVMGLHICAIDIDDGKLAHATRLGADRVINAKAGDPAAAVKKETGGGAHGVLITAPSLGAFKQGIGMTRKRGTCVLVGLPPGDFPVPLFDVVANCITIRGSFVGTREDMAEALAFAADGNVKADIERQPLSSINGIFDRLQHGDVASRVVLEFATT
jgi:propanol-preferring alcohol dehydrogenase